MEKTINCPPRKKTQEIKMTQKVKENLDITFMKQE